MAAPSSDKAARHDSVKPAASTGPAPDREIVTGFSGSRSYGRDRLDGLRQEAYVPAVGSEMSLKRLPKLEAMGSSRFGAVGMAVAVSAPPQKMTIVRGVDGCAMARDRG